jgi:hypothetical protein
VGPEWLRREFRVAFSRKAQPIWFRMVKWVIFLAVTRRLYGTRWFRLWALGGPAVGLAGHLFYRWKTRGWTEPWGGWNDVE